MQLLRTYPAKKPGYPFAPNGEGSVAHGIKKALLRACRLISVDLVRKLYFHATLRWPDVKPTVNLDLRTHHVETASTLHVPLGATA